MACSSLKHLVPGTGGLRETGKAAPTENEIPPKGTPACTTWRTQTGPEERKISLAQAHLAGANPRVHVAVTRRLPAPTYAHP